MPSEVLMVVGARPNFVKVAPVAHALTDRGVPIQLLHTGQHYDHALSGSFLDLLGMPEPSINLKVGSGTHAQQTAAVLVGVEEVLSHTPFELVLVAGDVNSTMAAAIAAAKLHVPVAHLESGLRSRDWTMPEEINRIVTDSISDLLLCTSHDAVDNLATEGVAAHRIALVGNTMIDSLFRILPAARKTGALEARGLEAQSYVLATLHRPTLVDDMTRLVPALDALAMAPLPVILPLHPRTRARLVNAGYEPPVGLELADPLNYLDFVALEAEAAAVVTDSGGVQEETSALGVPCFTYRSTTERPVTIDLGTNQLIGTDPERLAHALARVGTKPAPEGQAIPLWDGAAGPRCADVIVDFLSRERR